MGLIRRMRGTPPWRSGVDGRLWAAVERAARPGVTGPARELEFVRLQVQESEAFLATRYREDSELAAARGALAAAVVQVELAEAAEARVIQDTDGRVQRSARATGPASDQQALREDGLRVTVFHDTAAARTRVARTAAAAAEQALEAAGLAAVDRLHVAALDARRPIDAFFPLLNARLVYHGHPPVVPLDEALTDELVQRAVRATRLQPPTDPTPTDPTPEGDPR